MPALLLAASSTFIQKLLETPLLAFGWRNSTLPYSPGVSYHPPILHSLGVGQDGGHGGEGKDCLCGLYWASSKFLNSVLRNTEYKYSRDQDNKRVGGVWKLYFLVTGKARVWNWTDWLWGSVPLDMKLLEWWRGKGQGNLELCDAGLQQEGTVRRLCFRKPHRMSGSQVFMPLGRLRSPHEHAQLIYRTRSHA